MQNINKLFKTSGENIVFVPLFTQCEHGHSKQFI